MGETIELDISEATHIGPSVTMLLCLDLCYCSAQQSSLVFKDPAMGGTYEQAINELSKRGSQKPFIKLLARIAGLVGLLDNN